MKKILSVFLSFILIFSLLCTFSACERETRGYTENLLFDFNKDETAYLVVGLGRCDDKEIYIPPTHKGLKVEGIDDYAFLSTYEGCRQEKIEKVVIPEGLESIGVGAFSGCISLKEIEVASTVKTIGEEAFFNCPSLVKIVLPYGVKTIGASAFSYCTALKEIEIPSSIRTISDGLFWKCTSLEKIVLKEGLKEIEYDAFFGCEKLTNITLPNSLTYLGARAFGYCESLKSIKIPSKITSIYTLTFAFCTELESIDLPAGITVIENTTFFDCINLTRINFGGTMAEWQAIKFGDNLWTNVPMKSVHCFDGILED